MTISHTYDEARGCIAPISLRRPIADMAGFIAAVGGRTARLFAALRQQWTMRQIARFSDHRLRDIGFERDWDGSINRMQDRPAAARCGY
ncbi:uncharacterized protein YjiS (DUF1127 family) [Rhizobium sp. BK650]|uniref:DUF1127 domain-containing protein n=1 Tax=Rhizobium sp. BK650 TaxID=2586990 RepID=UPI0017B8043E|nr:DUF1127 domain-containing protein [Rhizobium sp. BK650]MBB3656774.1 uncharacterized protein YjiS (DUF1127 family) [Rhizobium sp. BK650]